MQIKIRSDCGRFCGFRNCEFFGVNIRNELLKSFIIERDKVVNVTIWYDRLNFLASFLLTSLISLPKNSFSLE